jgi:hypothetical protein
MCDFDDPTGARHRQVILAGLLASLAVLLAATPTRRARGGSAAVGRSANSSAEAMRLW